MNSKEQSKILFVDKKFDEFREITTTTSKAKLPCGGFLGMGGTAHQYAFQWRRFESKDIDLLMLDVEVKARDWVHLRSGNVIFNCDQVNYPAEYKESDTDVRLTLLDEIDESVPPPSVLHDC